MYTGEYHGDGAGNEQVYKVLTMMDFNSIQERMSVLVLNPEGSIHFHTKSTHCHL